MPTKPLNATDPMIQRLRALEKARPELKVTTRIYEAILPILREADLHAGVISLTLSQVREKMETGEPLLAGLDLDFDGEAVQSLMIRLAAVVEEISKKQRQFWTRMPGLSKTEDFGESARRVRSALETGTFDINELLPHLAAGSRKQIDTAARGLGLDPDLVRTLAQNALKPALRAWCRQLSTPAAEISWNKGFCFVCGSQATLAELQGNDQAKHLRCGTCGADWQVRRLQCSGCGNEDHKTQHYLYAEGRRDTMRVEVCDACKGYIKVIASFSPMPVEMITIEDLATVHLDALAQEQGYVRISSEASEGRSTSTLIPGESPCQLTRGA
jgi:FdhE protein